jgi:hypothetical protein
MRIARAAAAAETGPERQARWKGSFEPSPIFGDGLMNQAAANLA